MAFNINEMISKGLRRGVAKTAHFEVIINPPRALGSDTEIIRELSYRADSVEIPGRSNMTIDHRFTNNGPITKVPYSQMYPDVTITFICSEDFAEKRYLDLWMSKMIDTQPVGGEGGAFNVKYFDDYKSTVDIKQYDQTGELRTTTKLIDAYPISVNGVQMGWQDDSIAKVSAQFGLRYYLVDTVSKEETNESEVPQARFNGRLIT